MKRTSLVLILFLAGFGLRAQTPPAGMTPAQSNLFQTRLRMLTNRLPGVPARPLPAGAGAPLPSASAPVPPAVVPAAVTPGAPAAPSAAGAIPEAAGGTTPGARAASAAGASARETEPASIDLTFKDADIRGVLDFYAKLVNRTLLMGPPPSGTITLNTESPLTKSEAIEALQAVLGMNGVVLVNIGDKFVKVLPPNEAGAAGGAINNTPENQLPDLGGYVTRIVQLTNIQPSKIVNFLQPFSRMPNALTPLDDNGVLIIRDYAENVKRMLQMIAKIDVSVPAVYISEVIPIRYAMADDIANALNSLGGSGGATVAIGSSSSPGMISGISGNTSPGSGLGNMGNTTPGANQPNAFGQRPSAFGSQPTPNGTPSSTNPFQRRLLNIINSAGGGGEQQPIQVFGQAKIIADERANALLIFATRQDMEQIKHVISQLDVLLAQVLIESVIIDYSLGPNTLNFGVSAAQQPQYYSASPPIGTAGGFNNGQQLYNLLQQKANLANTNGIFSGALGGGLNYFGNIGNYWNVAIAAAASDSHASILQTPSIQTSQAKPAQFFVGDTVPYVTSTYNYGGAYGNQSSYSQLSVGVELDVTPFINPDGLVVMDIQQEIDDLNGYTTITGVGQIPNTIKRTLKSEITVSNQDTVVLGAFIKNSKSTGRSGVPILQDIPLLGGLFSQHAKSKQREELIVLMRPTVLETPQVAAVNTVKVEQTLPYASQAYADSKVEQNKAEEAQKKKELKNPEETPGFYTQPTQKMPPFEPQAPPPIQTYDTYPTMEPNGNNAQPQR
ncbi:MAG TPA: secretin N-terminal domain-containing protein [Verrucomicrobiae bacterium]|nr:secretin N-terminal domain-containing protein [Verrucomicrobiae bacterium]